jgi:hypothetical protein
LTVPAAPAATILNQALRSGFSPCSVEASIEIDLLSTPEPRLSHVPGAGAAAAAGAGADGAGWTHDSWSGRSGCRWRRCLCDRRSARGRGGSGGRGGDRGFKPTPFHGPPYFERNLGIFDVRRDPDEIRRVQSAWVLDEARDVGELAELPDCEAADEPSADALRLFRAETVARQLRAHDAGLGAQVIGDIAAAPGEQRRGDQGKQKQTHFQPLTHSAFTSMFG